MNFCSSYVGVSCVDGSCPIANADEYEERCMDVVKNCRNCWMYKGCYDCALEGTEYCEIAKKVGEKMTAQEAINAIKIKEMQIECKATRMCEFCEGLVLAEEALEKQIPKKILYRKQNYGTPWLCCECESDQTPTEFFSTDGSEPKEKHTYCWKCGQKLDWGDYK